MTAPILFFDIAGPDSKELARFYEQLFHWNPSDGGQFAVTARNPLGAAIREDPAEKRLYLGVSDITAKLAEIEGLGGSVDAPRFEVPGVVILGLFRDPAGNPMGLVEMDGDIPKVPG